MTSTPPPAKRLRLTNETSTIAIDVDNDTEPLTAPCSDIADDDVPSLASSSSSPSRGSSSRVSPIDSDDDDRDSTCLLERATNILAVEAAALNFATDLYRTCASARQAFAAAVKSVVDTQRRDGKVLFCGVGKSAYIAQKLTATCKSLSIRASFLHACEAAHGDVGDVEEVRNANVTNRNNGADVCQRDVIIFVSYSGRTPELMNILPHIPLATRVISLSSPRSAADCALTADWPGAILLTAPIPEKEEITFGVAAPTTSTTVALAVGDMLALTVANEMHQGSTNGIFKRNHPGGAIGVATRGERAKTAKEPLPISLPSPSISSMDA